MLQQRETKEQHFAQQVTMTRNTQWRHQRGAWGIAYSEATYPPPPLKQMQQSAVFGNFFNFGPLRNVFAPSMPPTKQTNK